MSAPAVHVSRDTATAAQIAAHLRACADQFQPPLDGRVDIDVYAAKLAGLAARFEAWDGDGLVGLVAMYCNSPASGTAFVSSVSVTASHARRGIASSLLAQAIETARALGFGQVSLEVGLHNASALALYTRLGFTRRAAEGRADDGTGEGTMVWMDLAPRDPNTAGGRP